MAERAESNTSKSAVGTSWRAMNSLENTLEDSISAAAMEGPTLSDFVREVADDAIEETHPGPFTGLEHTEIADARLPEAAGAGFTLSASAPSEARCADGADGDCDGLVDCADPDCGGRPPCAPFDAGASPDAGARLDAGTTPPLDGGTTTLLFDTRAQRLMGHRLSLTGTIRNCAGGPTPWGSWITSYTTPRWRESWIRPRLVSTSA